MIITKGISNFEFVLSLMVFISTVAFVTITIINSIPFMHQETIIEHSKTRAYQISHILLFDEGSPSDWYLNINNVAVLGLSTRILYNLSKNKIDALDDLCLSNPGKKSSLLDEPGIYTYINITNMDTGEGLTDNCVSNEWGKRFTLTRFAVINTTGNIAKIDITVIVK